MFEELDSPADPSAALARIRTDVLAQTKAFLDARSNVIQRQFEATHDASGLVRETTRMADTLIRTLFEGLLHAYGHETSVARIAILAVGGYGRDELFPFADWDVLFLHSGPPTKPARAVVEYLMYLLWDLKLKVGQAQRDVDETLRLAQSDIGIRTNLLDARLVCGNRAVFVQFTQRFRDEIIESTKMQFVEAKLAERDVRHKRFGDSRYLLEPNIKESKGGLRDLHTLYWIAKYLYGIGHLQELEGLGILDAQECEAFRRSRDLLWEIRAIMHYHTQRCEDRLTFDMQRVVASAMGFRAPQETKAVSRFMKRYFMAATTVGTLTRIFCALLEEQKQRAPKIPIARLIYQRWKLDGFALDGERLDVANEHMFEQDPLAMLRLFYVAQSQSLDIHPRALRLVTRHLKAVDATFRANPKACELFLKILTHPHSVEQTLRKMSETGLLSRFWPDFARAAGQMQFNHYHSYTVDEHSLVALGILQSLERGELKEDAPLATEAMTHLRNLRPVLYIAVLCHDIAKGRGGDHSEIGEKVALKLAARLRLKPAERETVAWLVHDHLLLSHTAFKRDLNDPQSLRDFVARVQSVERLRLLLVLTVVDIRAVGPNVWNHWKATLLREVVSRAIALMTGQVAAAVLVDEAQRSTQLATLYPRWNEQERQRIAAVLNEKSLVGWEEESLLRVAGLLHILEQGEQTVAMDALPDPQIHSTQLIVCTPDRHGLFSLLAGAIALQGANIVGAKISTLKNGLAMDVFQLQDSEGQAYDDEMRLARMQESILQLLRTPSDLLPQLASKQKSYVSRKDTFRAPSRVAIDNSASAQHTVIEVGGHDRVGFLYRVTKVLADQGVQIVTAHINTYGKQVADVFYVKDVFGMKIEHAGKLQQLKDALLMAAEG